MSLQSSVYVYFLTGIFILVFINYYFLHRINSIITEPPPQNKDGHIQISTHGELPSCMIGVFHRLCFSLQPLEQMSCHLNPERFLQQKYQTYAPTKDQLQTKDLMVKHQIQHLSVGASKAGVCGDIINKLTICTDRPQLDILEINNWMLLVLSTVLTDSKSITNGGFEVILAEHVLEHFDPVQVEQIAAAVFLVLKPGGRFRIAVPDGYKPSPSYQQYIRPGGTPSGAGQKHMVSWTADSLPAIFESTGFLIELKEYFTVDGTFVSIDRAYDNEDTRGKINRSLRHDHRNKRKPYKDFVSSMGNLYAKDLKMGEPMYTSLWFDAIKPDSCDYVVGL